MNIAEIHTLFLRHPKICTDSRQLEKDAIFVALKGENFNGNRFALQALESGCSYAITDEETPTHPNIIRVENTLTTIQHLAAFHRNYLGTKVIAITGTNGKTTTKELIAAVLKKQFNVLATQGNLNNHIGVPLTLLKLQAEHNLAVIEMGANHNGEIEALCQIASPNFGLITNIGKAHLEGFGSLEGVIATKTEMYEHLKTNDGTVFYNIDNEIFKPYISQFDTHKTIAYGTRENAFLRAELTSLNPFVNFDIEIEGKKVAIQSQLVGKYNFENILAAACIGHYFGVEIHKIKEAIEAYCPTNNRSQLTEKNSNSLLLDAYNANPVSMRAAIDNFAAMSVQKPKTAILGDMFELGADSLDEHKAILQFAIENNFDNLIVAGENFANSAKYTEGKFTLFGSTTELIEWLKINKIENSMILIKGSRGMKLERVVEFL